MLLSMTGYGAARQVEDGRVVEVEVRSVNNRGFRLVNRIGASLEAIEPEIDKRIRDVVRRGSVQVAIRVERPRKPEDYRLNLVALRSYQDQLQALRPPGEPPVEPALLIGLPGVVEDRRDAPRPADDWLAVAPVLDRALNEFQGSRAREGRAMAEALSELGRSFAEGLERVTARVPEVVASYQQRLLERVRALVADRAVVRPEDLAREVAILADRADVSEELTRLRAHLEQFTEVLGHAEGAGRRLEFVVQEMGRETNTIGSKANDVEISRAVFEMKGVLEKVRELIQNIE